MSIPPSATLHPSVLLLPQDQLSADMYSFVAKEIDYANYFQTVRVWKKGGGLKSAGITVPIGRDVGLSKGPLVGRVPEMGGALTISTCEDTLPSGSPLYGFLQKPKHKIHPHP